MEANPGNQRNKYFWTDAEIKSESFSSVECEVVPKRRDGVKPGGVEGGRDGSMGNRGGPGLDLSAHT